MEENSLTKLTPEALIAYFKVYFKENLVPTLFFLYIDSLESLTCNMPFKVLEPR